MLEQTLNPIEFPAVLNVDDHPENLIALEIVLGELKIRIVKAGSGEAALRALLQQEFAVILLDVQMPGMDGFEAARLIRQRERSEDTPIIFITAIERSEERVFEGYQSGAVDYILKPFNPHILRAKVSVFVRLFEMREKVRQQAGQLAAVNAALQQEIAGHKETQTLSLVDSLTGLYNRRAFLAFAEQALKLSTRLTKRLLLFYFDLDDLKRINDNLGHHEGDLALVETANVLKETFRDSDIIARLGGDEFVVLPIEDNQVSAEIIATRLRENLARHNAAENQRYRLSLSFGAAHYDPKKHRSIEELLADADTRMYNQKHTSASQVDLNVTPQT